MNLVKEPICLEIKAQKLILTAHKFFKNGYLQGFCEKLIYEAESAAKVF